MPPSLRQSCGVFVLWLCRCPLWGSLDRLGLSRGCVLRRSKFSTTSQPARHAGSLQAHYWASSTSTTYSSSKDWEPQYIDQYWEAAYKLDQQQLSALAGFALSPQRYTTETTYLLTCLLSAAAQPYWEDWVCSKWCVNPSGSLHPCCCLNPIQPWFKLVKRPLGVTWADSNKKNREIAEGQHLDLTQLSVLFLVLQAESCAGQLPDHAVPLPSCESSLCPWCLSLQILRKLWGSRWFICQPPTGTRAPPVNRSLYSELDLFEVGLWWWWLAPKPLKPDLKIASRFSAFIFALYFG